MEKAFERKAYKEDFKEVTATVAVRIGDWRQEQAMQSRRDAVEGDWRGVRWHFRQ